MSMDNEKSRAEFEAWARRRGIALWMHPNGSGKYYCGAAQQAFEAWIESRAALVVELPETFDKRDVQGIDYDEMIEALCAAGITVKEGA